MKTSRIFVLAALSLLAAACSKEQQTPEVNSDKITLDLFLENGTKTSVDGETGKVSWNDGDLVSIKETGVEAENIDASKISIDEDGVLHVTVADFQSEENYVTGFYPYTGENKVSDGGVTAILPSGQTAKAGTFSDFVSPTIGYGKISDVKENGLVMKNIGGLIRFKVASETVTSVKFEGQGSESIAGAYTADYNDGQPSVDITKGESAITLSGEFKTDTYYYIVALPAELENGIKVTITDNGTEYVKYGNNAMSITRNSVNNLGTLTSENSGSPYFTFKWYYAPNWAQTTDPVITYNATASSYTFNLEQATYSQWQAQLWFYPTEAFGTTKLESGKTYDFQVKITASNAVEKVTIKVYKEGDNDNFLFSDDKVALEAGVEKVYTNTATSSMDFDPVCILFDFGGNSANTEIVISEIKLQEAE